MANAFSQGAAPSPVYDPDTMHIIQVCNYGFIQILFIFAIMVTKSSRRTSFFYPHYLRMANAACSLREELLLLFTTQTLLINYRCHCDLYSIINKMLWDY